MIDCFATFFLQMSAEPSGLPPRPRLASGSQRKKRAATRNEDEFEDIDPDMDDVMNEAEEMGIGPEDNDEGVAQKPAPVKRKPKRRAEV